MPESTPTPNALPTTAIDEIWRSITDQLRLQMGRADFDAYVRETHALSCESDLFYVSTPSQKARDWLSSRLTSTINRHLAPLVGHPVQVRFVFPAPEEGGPGQKVVQRAENDLEKLAYFSSDGPENTVILESCTGPFLGFSEKRPASHSLNNALEGESENGSEGQGTRSGERAAIPEFAAGVRFDNVNIDRVSIDGASTANANIDKASIDGLNVGDTNTVGAGAGAYSTTRASIGGMGASTAPATVTGFGGEGADTDSATGTRFGGANSDTDSAVQARSGRAGFDADSTTGAGFNRADAGADSATGATEDGADSDDGSGDLCQSLIIEEIADTVETALTQPGRIVAFPRYELRHIPLVGPEAFFLRLAFLQERYLRTPAGARGQAFETSVEALLRWANVGRATLHRFKKGDPARGTQPAAGWFGIEQLPSAPRTGTAQQQPPCRYRLQQGIPLTPMDADRLRDLLDEAGIQADPLGALNSLLERPAQEILNFPPPAPTEEQRRRAPSFISVAGVVQAALGGQKLESGLRAKVQEAAAKLSDHITMPGQMVHVSWYFLQHWLPILGHDAAALVLYTRAQGYYNPQDHELRDEIFISGGYAELAQVSGLKRHRTIADWLPNIFDRQDGAAAGAGSTAPRRPKLSEPEPAATAETEKWQREQQRMARAQARIGQFIQVIPGSRKKMPEGHYAFKLRVEIKAEPLTPADQGLARWVHRTLAACAARDVLPHFHAWVTSPVIAQLAQAESPAGQGATCLPCAQNDGAGTLGGLNGSAQASAGGPGTLHKNDGRGILGSTRQGKEISLDLENDGWGILAAAQMTGGESAGLDDDGWGILAEILNDGAGIITGFEMTAGELFKGLLRLHTYWESILQKINTTLPRTAASQPPTVVGKSWDLRSICKRNGGMNRFREGILARESSAEPFLSWLYYAYSFKGRGVSDPVGWAFSRLKDQPGQRAGSVFDRLATIPPARVAQLLRVHVESGMPPADEDWRYAFRDVAVTRLKEMAETLGLAG